MSAQQAIAILAGVAPMPENVTVEALFATAHIVPNPPTPF